ncbi:MAG: sulfite exporter TauE/SafE family protein, partial [Candidatus Dormibacteraceae bacterium]
MSVGQVALLALAGFLAGALNAIIGSGSLITFPTLLAVGLPPLTANVTNTVGLVFGSGSAVVGYRRELRPQLRRALWLAGPSLLGAVTGAVLLLVLPQSAFGFIVSPLVAFAVLLVIVQPLISSRLTPDGTAPPWARYGLPIGIFLTGIYGGYFGAAQGVILMGLLTVFLRDPLQQLNGLKNVVSGVNNLVAALIFLAVAHIDWAAAGVIAITSIIGGQAGSMIGRRLSPLVLRLVIVAAGLAALVKL